MNKGFNKIEKYEELLERMKAAKITPFLSFVFGFDADTPDQFQRTLDFLKKNKINYASFWLLTPLPGTTLFEKMKNDNRIPDENWSLFDLSNVVYQPKNFSNQQLLDLYWKSYQELFSIRNLPEAVYQGVKISKKPIQSFFQTIFFHNYYRKKVHSLDHPFSGGIGRVQ